MKIFILEDDQLRINAFVNAWAGYHDLRVATSVPEAKQLWAPPYDLVCLDHDLGGEIFVPSEHENTGFAFCKWLTEFVPAADMASTIFVVHSFNPDGAQKMLDHLRTTYRWVYPMTFGPNLLKWGREYKVVEQIGD